MLVLPSTRLKHRARTVQEVSEKGARVLLDRPVFCLKQLNLSCESGSSLRDTNVVVLHILAILTADMLTEIRCIGNSTITASLSTNIPFASWVSECQLHRLKQYAL